jgi:eukaryotic-like serine/threonine-protein kinase
MGSVWEARHARNGRRAAVKLPHPHASVTVEDRAHFYREGWVDRAARAAGRLPAPRGPGAVDALDDGAAPDGTPFLVLEWLDGESPDRWAREAGGRLPPAAVAALLANAAEAGGAVHELGVVHRDLKPENLFVTRDGDLRVLDFGLAQLPGDPAPTPGHLVGTPGYAPPEQALGLPSTPASDVWGLGATAYALLAGRPPVNPGASLGAGVSFRAKPQAAGASRARDFADHPTCPVPPVRSVAPETPAWIAEVVDRALACGEGDRYPDALAMREDLGRRVEEELARMTRTD